MDNKKKWFFVFVNAPNTPYMIKAIFSEKDSVAAFDYCDKGGGYLCLRKGNWNGGQLPEYGETETI